MVLYFGNCQGGKMLRLGPGMSSTINDTAAGGTHNIAVVSNVTWIVEVIQTTPSVVPNVQPDINPQTGSGTSVLTCNPNSYGFQVTTIIRFRDVDDISLYFDITHIQSA
jgi:hypothetical protein